MAELHVMDVLREKQSQLVRLMRHLEQQLVQHRGSLTHLDATMRLFDPDLLSQNTDLVPQRGRVSWFGPGECRRLIYDVLRDAPQPLTTRELAESAGGFVRRPEPVVSSRKSRPKAGCALRARPRHASDRRC